MMLARYLENLLSQFDDRLTADAVEWAILTGTLSLYWQLETDLQLIHQQLPSIIPQFQHSIASAHEQLIASYGPIFSELSRLHEPTDLSRQTVKWRSAG